MGVDDPRATSAPRSDVLNNVIAAGAILMFVWIASSVLTKTLRHFFGNGEQADRLIIIALLLNVALILLGWRRQNQLSAEVRVRTAGEERAQQLAACDPLTGYLNRRSLSEEGAAMLAQAKRRGKSVALLMLDLDHFKTVNDMHGHATGDALLRTIANVMSEELPIGTLAARFGGDEFACAMLFDPARPDIPERVAGRLVSRLAQPLDADGTRCHVSSSIGIARSDFVNSGVDSLIRSADIAMYAAKRAGRNRFAWFDQSMERELKARNELETGLRSAISNQEILPYFEQQVDLATGMLEGFEVLARWEHGTRGLIGPDIFIPVAEESGMISELSMSIMRQAFVVARDWDPKLKLAINISPRQLRDAWLAQKIIQLLTETGFAANRLEIEITESALFENLALAQSIIGSLKNQGISVALDDFGTGYSSLAHLRALPFDRIKIDRSFVTSINESPDSIAIVNAIAKLGDSLNLPVTAEGVENREIATRLRSIGVAKAQGWLFGKPVSAMGVRRLLAEKQLLRGAYPSANGAMEGARRAG